MQREIIFKNIIRSNFSDPAVYIAKKSNLLRNPFDSYMVIPVSYGLLLHFGQ